MSLTLGMCNKKKTTKNKRTSCYKKKKKLISPFSDLNDYVCKGKVSDVDLRSVMESKYNFSNYVFCYIHANL